MNTKSPRRAIFPLLAYFLLLAFLMFATAGIGWWQGWLFLAVFAVETATLAVYTRAEP